MITMSSKGNCFDNAMVERFFKTLKSELVWRTAFQTRAEATVALARYIDGFYNPRRRTRPGLHQPYPIREGLHPPTALH